MIKQAKIIWGAIMPPLLIGWVTISAALTVLLALLLASQAFAENTITNVMSPVVSYQFYDALGENTNSAIVSPIISYQYFDWPGNDVQNLQSSPVVSFYYPFLDTPPLTIIPTNRTPTSADILPLLAALPTTSRLLVYSAGAFANVTSSIDPTQPTIVLTHGWIPTTNGTPVFPDGGVEGWPTTMAAQLQANGVFRGNILAWDWSYVASSDIETPGISEQQTGDQGQILGEQLLLALGPNYSKPIQFIGHSLGTLVNSYAANYLHGDHWAKENVSPFPWPATNTLMTLFDEAEVARGLTNIWADIDLLLDRNGNPFTPATPYDHPLPKQFAWAENYVAAVGLLQTNAANVILTNEFPANAPGIFDWLDDFATFHGYPIDWYNETIQTDNSAMGFVWPFLWSLGDVAFENAPSEGSVYVQAYIGSQWDLTATNWNYGTNLLAARYQEYRNSLAYALTGETPNSVAANGNVSAQYSPDALSAVKYAYDSIIMQLLTKPENNSSVQRTQIRQLGLSANDESDSANIPAYAWIPLVVPENATTLSFDYTIQGDWQSDSLAAAFNGTNVLSLPGSQIATNTLFSSGCIDVSPFAGQTNELFIGIVGGTSTNAQLTVENLAFSISSSPSLQSQMDNSNLILSWSLAAQNFNLQSSTNLAATNSWLTLTNIPAIANLQNTVTNPITGNHCFYRLIMQ